MTAGPWGSDIPFEHFIVGVPNTKPGMPYAFDMFKTKAKAEKEYNLRLRAYDRGLGKEPEMWIGTVRWEKIANDD